MMGASQSTILTQRVTRQIAGAALLPPPFFLNWHPRQLGGTVDSRIRRASFVGAATEKQNRR